jgi:hypothetical protein
MIARLTKSIQTQPKLGPQGMIWKVTTIRFKLMHASVIERGKKNMGSI